MAAKPIKIAILAMGGEGGGVLADWIVDLGEQNGYIAQTTSVPGVAQRTGATIYYVELFPRKQAEQDGQQPVLALMPMPGDVDIVLASELMEAGRAIQRGFVTRDRTTLVASTHRVYSMTEKMALGDGRVDSARLLTSAKRAAQRFIAFDMAEVAERSGSVISAVMFGALCATGTLPFSREQFEATIERGGVGVKASLRAFDEAYQRALAGSTPSTAPNDTGRQPFTLPQTNNRRVAPLIERIRSEFPSAAHYFILEGVRRLIDYQDVAYAALYLDRLGRVRDWPDTPERELLRETARHLALWMAYDDTIRVADLKTRDTRFQRVRDEVRVQPGQVLSFSEFMHPRVEEIADTVPAFLGRYILKPNWANRLIRRFTREGRIITTSSLSSYLMLWTLARMRVWRRSTLRFHAEQERIETWLQRIQTAAARNPMLAVEIAKCQGLIKGYSDTHERGLKNYQALMSVVDNAGETLAPPTLRELRQAALGDEHGNKLQEALQKHALGQPQAKAA